ncbi:hypothetical protein RIR_jg7263.t1 [Rhizophagus irregularis DAOM 181602=DAOM 197198]|nr:hypothetical protein RIR_jg7263.t1 [Rhizophagus irregularis DAOM 181602=DAOM 197198]
MIVITITIIMSECVIIANLIERENIKNLRTLLKLERLLIEFENGGTVDPKTRELLDNDKLISEITQRMGLLNLFVVK